MEACATGMPIFIKKSDITDDLYINKKNAFIFENITIFIELFDYFIKLDILNKKLFISDSVLNIKKYEQNIIFEYMLEFLINGKLNKNNSKINFVDMLSLFSISKFINCSGMVIGD
jgi:hypothetical protein